VARVKLVMDIEEEVRNRFKAKVAMEGRTIREVLTKAIEDYLKAPQCKRPRRADQ
jgi:hypothetical protein